MKAIELPTEERRQFLEEACNGDDTLRREVDSLLDHDVNEPLLSEPLPTVKDVPADMTGRRIGVYRLIRELGHGGMGSVHLAVRDDDEYRKEVAIKLLKRGMDTDFMLKRFRQERQILANLEHPFIARLIDGGATDDGLPYFVLEYVDGLPITKYCLEKNLTLNERLRLFRLVCEAVQHAHQSLVIHRDIKPGNILITREGIPKLLDFGIAKLIDPETPAGRTLPTLTRRELRLMTPAYASPEQARGAPINTSTDIYSLGAVLYELLTGHQAHRFTTETPAEVERTICDVEPQKPSLAARDRRLTGDLDNIVLTAMRKEPQRRYPSVVEFSEDIRRYMDGLPVTAHVDRFTYRAGKFVGRHRVGVATCVLVLLGLVAAVIATTFQVKRAERRFQLARGLATSMLFDFNDQLERLPGTTSARTNLVQTVVGYLDSLAREGGADPELDLEIAAAYRRVATLEGHPFHANLGQTALALNHYRKAIDTYERLMRLPAARDRAASGLIGSQVELSDIEVSTGNAASAMARLERAAAVAAESAARNSASVSPEALISLQFRMGDAASRRGDAEGALPYFQKALTVAREWNRNDQSLNARSLLRAAFIRLEGAQLASGDLDGARASDETSLASLEELARQPNAPIELQYSLAPAHRRMGDVLGGPDSLSLGDTAAALNHYRAAVAIAEKLSQSDPHDVRAREELQASYRRVGAALVGTQPAEALEYFRKAFALAMTLSEANVANLNARRDLASARLAVGEALHRMGRDEDALVYAGAALDSMQQLLTAAPHQIFWIETVVRAHTSTGEIKMSRGDTAGALQHFERAMTESGKLVEQAPANLYFHRDRADSFESLGRYYMRVAAQPGITATQRTDRRSLARSWFEKSQSVWQDWVRRRLAVPYATRREAQVVNLLTNLGKA